MNVAEQIKNFFGFSRIPFSKGLGVNELFKSSAMHEAMARLELAVCNEEAALITGASGNGKSNIVRYFVHQLDQQRYRPVYCSVNECKIGELTRKALCALNIPLPFYDANALRKFRQTVGELHATKNQKVVFIIDEAQELPPRTLNNLKSLLNYQMDNANMLFILLCGHATITETLQLFPLESLNRRIRIRYEVANLSLDETSAYIRHHLKVAGVTRNVFTDDALALIYQTSQGLISGINQLCFNAVIFAASESKEIIEPSMIQVS